MHENLGSGCDNNNLLFLREGERESLLQIVELDTVIDKSSSTIATPKQIHYPSPG